MPLASFVPLCLWQSTLIAFVASNFKGNGNSKICNPMGRLQKWPGLCLRMQIHVPIAMNHPADTDND